MGSINYTKTFRMQVVQEALKPELQGMEDVIANKYGIMPSTVERWKHTYELYGEDGLCRNSSKLKRKSSREQELEKEVAELKEEVEILKKAAAFLADLRRE